MNTSPEQQREIDAFPPALRALILAELEAGNTIAEIGHSFPAAPCGAYLRLSRAVTTTPRVPAPGLDFYDRNNSDHAGEFNDPNRHFFVLEPPRPPEPPPDMDALRTHQTTHVEAPRQTQPAPVRTAVVSERCARFFKSMNLDYEKWREGIGYDLTILAAMNDDERTTITAHLAARGIRDWRDAEALAALATPRAREVLRLALRDDDAEIRLAVQRFAPELVREEDRIDSLVRALGSVEIFGGLTEALHEVAVFHPPPIVEALFRGVLARPGDVAVHYAAMLWHLHGKSNAVFDMSERPLFLRFNTPDPVQREAAFRTLCKRLDVSAELYVQ